jgi:hypothetical protein
MTVEKMENRDLYIDGILRGGEDIRNEEGAGDLEDRVV